MAIRIPILTSFDPKGLRQANAQFAKLQSSVGSLGRNFAVAGAAIAGAGVLIGKSLADAADSQRVFAQTEAVLKSTGTTANGTAKQIANLAASLQKNTAFNDEAILSGQNLLLTFKGVQNQAGKGNDIFNQASSTMLDFARAMNTGPEQAAIKLGKALQDPTRGVTALRKSGVDFTKDQMEMIKSLQESGDLMGAQKIVLAELQAQFGGSAAAFAKTFTGQLESMNNELNDLSEEIGFMVMPAITELIAEFRDLIPVIGPQLKAAIESIDIPALAKSVVDLTKFLIANGEAIVKTIGVLFLISTAYKTMAVATGIATLATDLYKYAVAKAAAGTTVATVATTAFSTALRLIPFVAIAAGLAFVVAGIIETNSSYRKTTPVVTSFGEEILKTGHDAEWAAGKYGVATKAATDFKNVVEAIDLTKIPRTAASTRPLRGGQAEGLFARQDFEQGIIPDSGPTPRGGSGSQTVSQAIREGTIQANREAKLLGTGISAGFAGLILSKVTGKTSFQKELGQLTKTTESATKAQARFNKTAAGRSEVAQLAAEASAAASSAASEFAATEAAALAERERVYKSFADSVKNTFAGIKNSILGAFDITQLGGSTDAITRNMDKMLVKLRSFSANVKSLATMGLNPALLQQVISAGPMAGARLAESLVMGGAGGLSAINAGFSEFGNLSSQIAQTGTESLFGTATQQSIYNISVDGGVGSGSTIGKAIVDAIKAYERTSGAVFQGA